MKAAFAVLTLLLWAEAARAQATSMPPSERVGIELGASSVGFLLAGTLATVRVDAEADAEAAFFALAGPLGAMTGAAVGSALLAPPVSALLPILGSLVGGLLSYVAFLAISLASYESDLQTTALIAAAILSIPITVGCAELFRGFSSASREASAGLRRDPPLPLLSLRF